MNADNMGPIQITALIEEMEASANSDDEMAQHLEDKNSDLFQSVNSAWERLTVLSNLAVVLEPEPVDGFRRPGLISAPIHPIDMINIKIPGDWNNSRITIAGENQGSVVLRLAVEYYRLQRPIAEYNTAKKRIEEHSMNASKARAKKSELESQITRLKAAFGEDEVV